MSGSKRNSDQDSIRKAPSDRFFRSLEDFSPIGAIVADKNALIRYMNQSAEEILGYRPGELLGRNLSEIIHPDSFDDFDDIIGPDAIHSRGQARLPADFLDSEGERRRLDTVVVNAIDHPDIKGVVLRFHQPFFNVNSYGELADSEKKYRLLCENTREIILLLQDGVIQFANSRAEIMTGYSLSELIGRSILEFILPESMELAVERHAQAMSGKVLDNPAIYRVRDRWGKKHWLSAIGIPTTWDNTISVLFLGEDVTDQVEAENTLRESEMAYRTIFDFIGDSVAVIQDGRFAFVNPKTMELFGYDRETLLKKNFFDLIHPDHREMVYEKYNQRLSSYGRAGPV